VLSRGVDCLKIVPSHLGALLQTSRPRDLLPGKLLVLGGEATPAGLVEQIRELAPQCRIMNHYGPTETTVGVTTFEHQHPNGKVEGALPIGRPLANCETYLLDSNLRPVPAMTAGELCVGGACLSRGYLGRPDLTAERFLPNPTDTNPGARIYRTGDLAQLRPEKTLEFLGRIDNQVKIRGFRIELGEIENALSKQPDVARAVVVARSTAAQTRQLVAYVVVRPGSDVSQSDLRTEISRTLPEYMVPSAIEFLDSLPLTANGKVDREALCAGQIEIETGDQQALPRTAEEKALADIWAGVLGIPRVGIHDNFFELGGDSILAIQVVARANRAGLRLTPKQIFDEQTIAGLARIAGSGHQIEAEQGLVTGPVALNPIQHWFFEQGFVEPHHWNQSVILEVPSLLAPDLVETAVMVVIAHHDALRLRFEQTADGWRQAIAGMDDAAKSFTRIDVTGVPDSDLRRAIEPVAQQLQASLNLSEGPICKFALFNLGDDRPHRLLIIAHHLAVDGVSWGVILEDLETVCDQLLRSEPVDLPPKTSSFKEWSERLAAHVGAGAFSEEMPFWLQEGGEFARVPQDGDGPNTIASATSVECSLDQDETSIFLLKLPEAYATQINAILLTAIARGFAACTGSARLLVEMEGHGREGVFEDIDISRTVGWFTIHFPVLLDIGGAMNSHEALRLIKDQLRRIPNNGIGFGLLRYLSKDPDNVAGLRALPTPDIKFNYLGRYDQTFAKPRFFGMADEFRGGERNPGSNRSHLIDVDALVLGERLRLKWTFSENLYNRHTISRLANAVRDELRRLISLKDAGQQGLYAPSDFPLVQLNERRLEHIAQTVLADRDGIRSEGGSSERQIEDIYPVSPLQESLLSHTLSTQGSGAGFEQKSLLLRGDFDLAAFNTTWQELIDRHPILRTAFVSDSLAGPLQVVLRRVRIPIEHQDWQSLPSSQQDVELEQYLRADRGSGFDLASPPLMRVGVIRLAKDTVRLVWSYHHLLIDAWCRNLVLQEVFEIYDARRNGRVPELPERRPCRDYIGWLQKQDYAAAEQFWRDQLRGFVVPTRLPMGRRAKPGARTENYKTRVLQLKPTETETIASFARTNRLTLNTLLHAAWALLLSRYCDTEDVLIGTTVAGRPPELRGSEAMLGMFINNLPVRVRLPGDSSVLSVLHELQDRLVSMREYEWVSPLKLQEWSDLSRGNRLFESLLIFQNYPLEGDLQGAKTGLEMQDVRSRLETAYPLTVVAGPFDPLTIRIFYDSRRLEDSEIGRIAEHLGQALIGMVSAKCIADVSILSEDERRPIVSGQHHAAALAASKVCLHRLIEQQVDRKFEEIALRGQQDVLSWNEMNRRANRLARQLTKAGAGPERIVAILLDRTVEFAVGLLAVLKTGAGFAVIDHSGSDEGISEALERTRPQALLVSRTRNLTLPGLNARLVFAGSAEAGTDSDSNLPGEDEIKGVACLDFATGADLAKETTHEALFDQASNFASIVAPGNSDTILIAAASPGLAAIEVLTALAAGAQVVIADDESLQGSSRLTQTLRDSGAAIMQAPPSTWRLLVEQGWEGKPDFKAICPTRRLPGKLCRELSARTGSLIKVYKAGADERWLAACRIEPNDVQGDFDLIGTPVDGISVQLLSPDSHQVPIGVVGEICIGDAGKEAKYWRTGDLGRRLEDGSIEVRGRVCRRVEIKGETVDPFDVETELLAYPELSDVAVMAWENAEGEPWLGAYIVADFSAIAGVEQLVDFAKTRLPRHALPDFYVALDRLPLTRDGEVDYQALPAPDATGVHVEVVWQEFCDPVQLQVKRIWEDLFGFQPIGIRENFFELGGHSILAVRLMSEISKQFGRDLPISTLLNGATIEHLAEVVRAEAEPDSWSPLVQIQAGSEKLPLFCVHATGGEVLNYVELAHFLGPDQPVYGLQSRGFAEGREGARRIEEMASIYLTAMRKVQPHGPYCITGYSFGGVIALEMAQQLYSAGERQTWLGVLDTNLMDNLPGREIATRPGADDNNTADWAQLILNCARHGTTITAEDLRQIGSLDDQVAYAIEHGILPYNLDLATAMRYVKAGDDNSEAKALYVSRPYPGRICLLRALQGHVLKCADPTLGWGSVAQGGLEICDVPGAHWNMLGKPHVKVVAGRIRAFIDRVQAERPLQTQSAGSH
jgi:non-ribosomal peptide synthase protein (TIGR01720 family)